MPASWRICNFEPRAFESANMYTGLSSVGFLFSGVMLRSIVL